MPAGVRVFVCTAPVDLRFGLDRLVQTAGSESAKIRYKAGRCFFKPPARQLKILWKKSAVGSRPADAAQFDTLLRPRREHLPPQLRYPGYLSSVLANVRLIVCSEDDIGHVFALGQQTGLKGQLEAARREV